MCFFMFLFITFFFYSVVALQKYIFTASMEVRIGYSDQYTRGYPTTLEMVKQRETKRF